MAYRIVYGKERNPKRRVLIRWICFLFFLLLFLIFAVFSPNQWISRLRNIMFSDTLETFVEQCLYD